MKLILVRHGDVNTSNEEIFHGQSDVPLTPLGEKQAQRTAKKLSSTPVHKIYSSPLQRAYNTARAIAEPHGLDVEILNELNDIHYGAWQGLTLAEVKVRYEPLYNIWARHPEKMKFPDGESVEDVAVRAQTAANKIFVQHPDETVALVAHRIITKSLALLLIGQNLSSLWSIRHDPCSITSLDKTPYGFVLTLHNDTCHLKNGAKELND